MHRAYRYLRPLIAAAVLMAPAASQANIGMGQGMGIMDLGYQPGTGGGGGGCGGINFLFDWSQACASITAVIR